MDARNPRHSGAVGFGMRKHIAWMILALAALMPQPGYAQQQGDSAIFPRDRGGVRPEARQAIMSGRIVTLDDDGMTIDHLGEEIEVDAESLVERGLGSMDDYYEEGMFVTVEGTLTDEDEIAASRITRGARVNEVPPYIVNNPGIIGADELD